MNNNHIIKMLTEIVTVPGIDLSTLQKKLKIDDKELEYFLKKANQLLADQGYSIIDRRKKKVWLQLDIEDLNILVSHLQEQQLHIIDREARHILITVIIFSTKGTSLKYLSELFKVSKNTIVNDLSFIRASLQKESLNILYTRKLGYFIKGKEIPIRIMIIRQLHSLLDKYWEENMILHFTKINHEDVYIYKEKLINLENGLHTQFSARQIQLMSILLPILQLRIEGGGKITKVEYEGLIEVMNMKDYYRMERSMEKLTFANVFRGNERAFLIIQLLSANVVKSNIDETTDLGIIINKVISIFETRAVISFDDKNKLKQMLYQHLGPTIYRLKYGIPYEDHEIEDLVHEYRTVFPTTKQALKPIEEHYQVRFNEIETIYVGLIFQSCLNKNHLHNKSNRLRALVVCENGIAVSNLLYSTLTKSFPMIEFVANVSAREFYENPLVYSDISVVFSTIYLKTTKTIFIVSPLLKEFDKQRLITTVNQVLYGREEGINVEKIIEIVLRKSSKVDEIGLRKELQKYFSPQEQSVPLFESKFNRWLPLENIRLSKRKFDFEGAINAVAEPLLKKGVIERRYVKKILENYNEQYPYFVIAPGIAIPHANYNDGVNKLGFSLLKLENPVRFSDNLSVYILLMIAPIDNTLHQNAIQEFYNCVTNEKNRQKLMNTKSANEISSFFLKMIK